MWLRRSSLALRVIKVWFIFQISPSYATLARPVPIMLPHETEDHTSEVAALRWQEKQSEAVQNLTLQYIRSQTVAESAQNFSALTRQIASTPQPKSSYLKNMADEAKIYAQVLTSPQPSKQDKVNSYLNLAQAFSDAASDRVRPNDPTSQYAAQAARTYLEACRTWANEVLGGGGGSARLNQALSEMNDSYSSLLNWSGFGDPPRALDQNTCPPVTDFRANSPILKNTNRVLNVAQLNAPDQRDVEEYANQLLSEYKSKNLGQPVDNKIRTNTLSIPNEKRRIILKDIPQGVWNGPRTDDFIERIKVFKQIALKKCGLSPTNVDECISEVNKQFDAAENKITTSAHLVQSDLEDVLENKKKSFFKRVADRILGKKDPFKDPVDRALFIMQNFLIDLSTTLKKHSKEKFSPSKLFQLEAQYLSGIEIGKGVDLDQIRPSIANIYRAGITQERKYLSLQQGFSTQVATQTSALRNIGGLANAVRTSFHSFDSEESDVPKLKFAAYRYAVPVPIAMKDQIKRQSEGMKNYFDLLNQIVEDKKKASRGKCPKTIDLSTMILVTPISLSMPGDKNINEYEQLKETRLVARLFNGKTMTFGNCSDILIRTNLMNLEANTQGSSDQAGVVGWLRKVTEKFKHDIQSDINAAGYVKHEEDVHRLLSSLESQIQRELLLDPNKPYFNRIWYEIKKLRTRRDKNTQGNQLLKANLVVKEIEGQLASLYEDVSHLLGQVQSGEVTDHEKKNEYSLLMKKIDQGEQKLGELNGNILGLMKAQYLSDSEVTRKEERELSYLMDGVLKEVAKSTDVDPNSNLIKTLDQYRDVMRLYSDNKELLFSNKTEQWKYKFDFPRNFLLLNNMMGTSAFHCKSAEDRTGRVNDRIEQALIFKDQFGRFPTPEGLDEDEQGVHLKDLEEFNSIGSQVFYLSASRETNSWNNWGARGLQISLVDQINSPGDVIRAKWDKTIAKLAKKVKGRRSITRRLFDE